MILATIIIKLNHSPSIRKGDSGQSSKSSNLFAAGGVLHM